ncbi:MAG: hypothetical protein A2902_04245 [Elusimicrobia bacterium RIFCSPLOWO2_01_FULL_64_13]|nr:MAG: hypothetical protein A2902_04245 [Elusimicrobia bacterium RIFCSPLOWO2_01_FULL_64_13]
MNHVKAAGFVLLTLCLGPGHVVAEQGKKPVTYVLAGSGTNLAITSELARAFMEKNPGVKLHVPESMGSTGGLKALHKGRIHAALVSRPLRKIEKTWNLKVTAYARTIVVFGANPSVPDSGVTADQVLSILDGRTAKWSDGSPITVLIREEGDSGAEVLTGHFKGMREVLEKAYRSGIWRIEYTDRNCNHSIARIKGSFGWTDLGSVRLEGSRVKTLNLDGVEPTAENLASGRYPLSKELSFAYAEPLPEDLRRFIAFALSPEGRGIVARSGYVPLR